jgi:hypothetical protein
MGLTLTQANVVATTEAVSYEGMRTRGSYATATAASPSSLYHEVIRGRGAG